MGKTKICTMVFAIALSFIFINQSFAQDKMKWSGSGGWATGSTYNKLYDSKTSETFSGEVVSVDVVTPMEGMSNGVNLLLRTDIETVSVHLGPSWYVENQDINLLPMDKVEVKGSLITLDGKPVVIATEIKKGDETLHLRDDKGSPVWSNSKKE